MECGIAIIVCLVHKQKPKAKCTQQNWPEISTQLANLCFRKRQPRVEGGGGYIPHVHHKQTSQENILYPLQHQICFQLYNNECRAKQ